MDENVTPISIYEEDGITPRPKEDFLNDIADLYDAMIAESEEERQMTELYEALEHPIDIEHILVDHDFKTRVIYLTTEIDKNTSFAILRKVRYWNQIDKDIDVADRTPIKIFINTPGGDIQEVFNIISTIKMSKTPIYTITYGCSYSGGFFIGICGHKRFCFANSSFLFHEGMAIDGGDAHKFLQHTEYYKSQLEKLKSITIANTKITLDEYNNHKKDDWYLNPSEALHYGVVDEILEEFKEELYG